MALSRAIQRVSRYLSIATTEVGLPSVAHPGKRVYDIAGLNETAIAHGGFSAPRLLDELRPDVIYLPEYPSIKRAIEEHPTYLQDYLVVHGGRLARRRSGPYFDELQAIVTP